MHFKLARQCSVIVLLALLSACAQLGIPAATTFSEKLAAGYSAVTQVRQSATILLQAQKLTAEDGKNVLDATNGARAGLDVARTLSKTDMTAADAKLTAIRTILTGLSTYLATRGN